MVKGASKNPLVGRGAAGQVPLVMGATWTLPPALGTTVTAAQLEHRVPCWGYVLQEAAPPLAPARALLAEHGIAPVRARATARAMRGGCRQRPRLVSAT